MPQYCYKYPLFLLRFPDFRPFPYHPIGFNVEVVGVVGPLLTEDAGDSVLESSSFLSLRDFVRFFFFRFLRLLSSLGVTFLSLDCLRDFKASSLSPFSLALSWFVSSSPLPSSDDDSELEAYYEELGIDPSEMHPKRAKKTEDQLYKKQKKQDIIRERASAVKKERNDILDAMMEKARTEPSYKTLTRII